MKEISLEQEWANAESIVLASLDANKERCLSAMRGSDMRSRLAEVESHA
jgi:hypothetical protein